MAYNVSIATRPLVYSTFRYINNKVWNALAEYIDNSIQSFENHIDVLKAINKDGKLHVSVSIDFDKDVITIVDDAYGIEEENYQRAFELANLPLDNQGLNEFGMGMKVSSIWLSNTWTVETSAYGEPVQKTMTFDLKEVVDNEEMELPVSEKACSSSAHYTKITLRNLSMNKPTSRQISYIKKHLESIYTKHLREKSVEILLNGLPLEYVELKVLNAPYYSTPNGPAKEWRKEISFGPVPLDGKMYSVKGFIGVLETMSTSENNGFLLFRRGRVIGSSYDDRYRPKILCGQEGSPQYKRIFGELHLEGFDVSFTKNSFQEDDDFTTFIELLKDDLTHDKSLDLFGQAQNYTKPKSQKEIKDLGATLVKQIAKGFSKPIIVKPTETIPIVESHPAIENPQQNDDLNIPPTETTITLSDGNKVPLQIRGEKWPVSQGLYSLTGNPAEKIKAIINLNNPVFKRFDKSLSTPEGIEQLAYVISVLVASEVSLQQDGTLHGKFFRDKFNTLFGTI